MAHIVGSHILPLEVPGPNGGILPRIDLQNFQVSGAFGTKKTGCLGYLMDLWGIQKKTAVYRGL